MKNKQTVLLLVLGLSGFFALDARHKARHAKEIEQKVESKTAAEEEEEDYFFISDKTPVDRKKLVSLDKINIRVDGPERTRVLCQSDFERQTMGVGRHTIQSAVQEELIYQDALLHKIQIDDDAVRTHLRRTVERFGLKPGDEHIIFAQEGYSPEEGFERFRTTYAVGMMTDHTIRSNLSITEKEVQQYHDEHPITVETAYKIQMAPVTQKAGQSSADLEKQVQRMAESKDHNYSVEWSDPSWINESDLSDSLKSILDIDEGGIGKLKISNGYELYRLVEKNDEHAAPLNKSRYMEISAILQEPKYKKLYSDYTKKLFSGATIIDVPKDERMLFEV